jgi:hypothetical protein
MPSSMLGMTVAREIPDSALAGLATGKYTLHGGVIRWASGTPQAGQIVCHFVPAAGAPTGSIFSGFGIVASAATLAAEIPLATAALPIAAGVAVVGGIVSSVVGGIAMFNTIKILKAAKQIMALAEMNLAATRAGFSALEQRLDQLEGKLDEIKTTVTAVLTLLRMEQRAELRVALDHLNRIGLISDPQVRCELLVGSATTLGKISLIYEQHLNEAGTLAEAMISEEYYCIAMLAQVRCYAELRELAMARHILETMRDRWQRLARQIMIRYLLGPHPEKFLGNEFAATAPILALVEWLDFAYAEAKGLAWIDELRAKSDPWYYYKSLEALPASRKIGSQAARNEIVDIHHTTIIPALQKLVARNSVLDTYLAQYELMEQHQLTAFEFENALASVRPEDQVDNFIILEPYRQVAG